MSARISGVKNFVSQKISFVRGFPFSHVQSASENGSIFFFSGAWVAAGLADVLDSLFGPIAAAMLAAIDFGTAPTGALVSIADGALPAGAVEPIVAPRTLDPGSAPFSRTAAGSAVSFPSF